MATDRRKKERIYYVGIGARIMSFKRKAVTLIEVIVVVVLSSLIIIALMNLFSSGMKGSAKGLAHQINMESASIIMSQIEYDLLRATSISKPDANVNEDFDTAIWNFYYAASGSGKPSTVTYTKMLNDSGVCREVKMDGGKVQKTVFAKLQKVDLKFKHFRFNTGSEKYPVYKHSMLVEVTVSSKDSVRGGTNEPFTLRKLIVIRNTD